MSRTILFSPVGGTDPISLSNCYDGSLLHICRVYRPESVYLYMSSEIYRIHEEDNRYLYCLEKLCELQDRPKMECNIIKRETLTKVQEYDIFFGEFYNCLKEIQEKEEKKGGDYEILVNVSSGTPAMKSGLLVLAVMTDIPCRVIQVITPMGKMNEHIHNGYDVETLWELDEDNRADFVNRCHEVHCPTLSMMKQQESLCELIKKYDYSGALEVAKQMKKSGANIEVELLEMALARFQLNLAKAKRIAQQKKLNIFPVQSSDKQKLFEYAVNMSVKAKKNEFVDFVRALTPLLADLFELILKEHDNINVNNFCVMKYNGVRNWNRQKLLNTEIDRILNGRWRDFRYGDVYSSQLIEIIIAKNEGNAALIETVNGLREVERTVRNIAAHEIVSVTDEEIKNKTGFTSLQVMGLVKKAFNYTNLNIKSEYWNTYDDMNDKLIESLGEVAFVMEC